MSFIMKNKEYLHKFKAISSAAKASVALFLANVVSAGMQYLMTPVYTRLLTQEEYGQVSIFLTWTQVFGIVAMFCLSYGVFNNGMLDYPQERDTYSFSMLVLSNIITVCFSILLIGAYPWIKNLIGLDIRVIFLMCVLFLFQPAYNFYVARKRYEYKYKSIIVWTILSAIFSPLIAVFCILNCKNRLYGQIFGSQVPLILLYSGFCLYLAKKASFSFQTKYWKNVLIFNMPLIPHYLSQYLLSHSDRIMISWLIGDAATAHYSVAYAVASVATIVWTAINSSLIPYTYEKCRKNDYKAISAVTMPILTVIAAICVLVVMMAPEIVSVMVTPDYREAIYVIPPIVGGVFFQIQYFIYANIVYYYKRPRYVMYASVASTILNIILNYIFIPIFGYIAAGYTTLISYMLQTSFDFCAMKKLVGNSIYDMRYLGVISLLVVCVSLLSNMLYDFTVIRYIVITSLLVAAMLSRQRWIEMIKRMKEM